jgi:hypothetical protein
MNSVCVRGPGTLTHHCSTLFPGLLPAALDGSASKLAAGRWQPWRGGGGGGGGEGYAERSAAAGSIFVARLAGT